MTATSSHWFDRHFPLAPAKALLGLLSSPPSLPYSDHLLEIEQTYTRARGRVNAVNGRLRGKHISGLSSLRATLKRRHNVARTTSRHFVLDCTWHQLATPMTEHASNNRSLIVGVPQSRCFSRDEAYNRVVRTHTKHAEDQTPRPCIKPVLFIWESRWPHEHSAAYTVGLSLRRCKQSPRGTICTISFSQSVANYAFNSPA